MLSEHRQIYGVVFLLVYTYLHVKVIVNYFLLFLVTCMVFLVYLQVTWHEDHEHSTHLWGSHASLQLRSLNHAVQHLRGLRHAPGPSRITTAKPSSCFSLFSSYDVC